MDTMLSEFVCWKCIDIHYAGHAALEPGVWLERIGPLEADLICSAPLHQQKDDECESRQQEVFQIALPQK